MNILIINASPRKQGNISQLLSIMKAETEIEGAEVTFVRVADLKIHPCIACMSCRKKLECCLPEDDAQRILQLIKQADALIIGAPCYWGNIPGELKVLFDRMVYGMMGENRLGIPVPLHKGKKAIIVSTSTTAFPFNILFNQTRGVVKALKEILKWSGFKVQGTIEIGGTKNAPLRFTHEVRHCQKLVQKMLRSINKSNKE